MDIYTMLETLKIMDKKILKLVSRAMDDTRTMCESERGYNAEDLNAILEHATNEILTLIDRNNDGNRTENNNQNNCKTGL